MVREIFGVTGQQSTEVFGRLYDAYSNDKEAEERLAEMLDTTARIVENQNKRRLEGKHLSGELLPIMCCRIDKAVAFGLEIDDPRLSQSISGLLVEYREEIREEYEDDLREREQALAESEAELDRREAALAEETERSRAEMSEGEDALEERRLALQEREFGVAERVRQVQEREAEVKASDADIKKREERISNWTILRNEFSAGGLLEPEPGKTLALARAEFEERFQNERCSQYDRYDLYGHRYRAKRDRRRH